jgi:hypothetical protein
MLVALGWLLLVRPLLDARLVTPSDSGLIDSTNAENDGNELYC